MKVSTSKKRSIEIHSLMPQIKKNYRIHHNYNQEDIRELPDLKAQSSVSPASRVDIELPREMQRQTA